MFQSSYSKQKKFEKYVPNFLTKDKIGEKNSTNPP
jgi:hypothetical protein